VTDQRPHGDDLFFAIHRDLPREGPGEDASTLRALDRVRAITPVARIVDIGCGPGMQTIALASASDAHVTGVDTHVDYLEQLRTRAARARVSGRVHALRASMFDLPLQAAAVDLVWAEGAIYIVGFERGLREWRQLVRRDGCVAVTHLSWLTADPPDAPRQFWASRFPAMATVEDNLRIAERCGYDVVDHFTLPESGWWNDYYRPLEQRLASLRATYASDSRALAVLDGTQEQIDLFRGFPGVYGYVFYVLRRT
jgi:SAM-dependent methyltransferase